MTDTFVAGKMSCGRVTLRAVEESDYPNIQRWQNELEVYDLMDFVHPFAAEDIEASEKKAREEGHAFIIEVDGVGVGRIGLNDVRTRDHRGSLYVFIGVPDARGRGYGTDAIVALVGYAFDRLDLHLVEAWGLEGNERAFACYAHSGFVHDATLRDRSFRDGAHRAHVVMSVTRDEFGPAADAWIAQRATRS